MLTLTRRKIVAILTAAFAVAVGMSVASAAEDKKETKETKEKPLSPETILEKKLLGKATVEFLVDEVVTLNIDSVFVPDVSHAQILKAKVVGAKESREFCVIVSRETATQMLRSGIVDPARYFRAKVVRVSGNVELVKTPSAPAKSIYKIHVTSLDQLESIRTP